MDTEQSEQKIPKPSVRRARIALCLYFLYLTVSFAALCFYLARVQHAGAYLIILAWVISVLVIPTPRFLLLNRRRSNR